MESIQFISLSALRIISEQRLCERTAEFRFIFIDCCSSPALPAGRFLNIARRVHDAKAHRVSLYSFIRFSVRYFVFSADESMSQK